MRLLAAVCLMLLPAVAGAADKQGKYLMGAGPGASSCPRFQDAMATARQRGGLDATGGAQVIEPFITYVLGFQTGYNVAAPGTYDIFAKLHDWDPLYAIEAWCKDNPTRTFGDGVVALAVKLSKDQ